MQTTDEIMQGMGFSPWESGPYVTQLRTLIARQVSEGLVNRSAGTWGDDCYDRDVNGLIIGYKISAEERARAFLEVEWELQQGHSCRIESFDPPICRTFNTKTMRRGVRVRWSRLLPWVGDQVRRAGMHYRVWRDRKVLRLKNPFVS